DTTTPGLANEFSSFAGGGNGDANFGVAYFSDYAANNPAPAFDPANPATLARLPTITLPTGEEIESIQVTNTTNAALSMRDGDAFAKKFGGAAGDDPDFLKITAYGTDSSGAVITPLSE